MSMSSRRSFVAGGAVALLAIAVPAAAQVQVPATARNRALFSVTDNDPGRWNLILNNMSALREGLGNEDAEIELVAYGPGLLMLKADSPVKQRIAEALKSGVRINACQNTMNGMKLTPADILPEVGYVPSGVVEVMRRQQQGWAYIRS